MTQLVLVITGLGGRFGINRPRAYLKILNQHVVSGESHQTNLKHFVLKLVSFNSGQ